jgi:hypothetical protein
MENAAAGGHPLHIARSHFSFVAEAVAVFHGTGKHVGDGFDAAMGMPRETRQIVLGIFIAKIVEEQKRIEIPRLSKTECPLELNTGAFDRGLRLNNLFDRTE